MKVMNKYMALLFAVGAMCCFGLSQKVSYTSQSHNKWGGSVGPETVVYVTPVEKIGFITLGAICLGLCIYFVVQTRNEKLRK